MNKLIEKIQSLLEEKGFVLIGIDGLGGAGKSTVAKYIKEKISNTTIIEMDDFYVPELTRPDWDRVCMQVIDPCGKICRLLINVLIGTQRNLQSGMKLNLQELWLLKACTLCTKNCEALTITKYGWKLHMICG